MKICEAFNLPKYRVITFIGGGGKTTTLLALAKELQGKGVKTIITATTKMAYSEVSDQTAILRDTFAAIVSELGSRRSDRMVLGSGISPEGKLIGIVPKWIDELAQYYPKHIFLVEGDGAARKPFKAHGLNEPVVPASTGLLVGVVGVEIIGLPLTEDNVHRAELACALTGVPLGAVLTPEIVAAAMMHAKGYRKNLPVFADFVTLINKVESQEQLKNAKKLAHALLAEGCPKVVIGAMQHGLVREVML